MMPAAAVWVSSVIQSQAMGTRIETVVQVVVDVGDGHLVDIWLR